jgi:hypothetical protein
VTHDLVICRIIITIKLIKGEIDGGKAATSRQLV